MDHGGQPTRRPRRFTDEQTARQVLDTALAMLAEEGISVGLERLRFEDVIRAAGVSRSSAYRRWPSRDAFVADVLVELAQGTGAPGIGAVIERRAADAIASHAGRATDLAGRRDLFIEMVRLTFKIDLAATVASAEFRSYLALRAAVAGVDSASVRERVAGALAVSERRTVARGAAIIARAAELFGLRLVAPLTAPGGFEVVARGVAAASVGFIVSAQTDPGLLTTTRDVAAYGSARTASWSVPVYVLAGLVLQHLEPDPDAGVLPAEELLAALAGLVGLGDEAAAAAGAVPGGVSGS